MIGLCLIVETPRGSEAGHRFLTSRHDMGDSEVASVATEASQNAVGRSYISVSRQVTQRLTNGAVREGAERMILVGLDVDLLQPEQMEQLKSELTRLLPSLDTLIASMDWPSGNRSTVIACQELRNWVAGEMFAHLPLSEWTVVGCSQKSAPPLRSMKNWVLIGTIILACGGMIWLSTRPDRPSGITNDPGPPLPVNDEARVKELVSDWDCKSEDLVRSLKRANNWDSRTEADGLSLIAALADPDVIAMLNKLAKRSGPDQFWVSPSTEGADGLRRFVNNRPSLSAKEMTNLRGWLFLAWQRFDELKRRADKARPALIQADTKDAFARMLVSVADIGTEVGLGDCFQNPTTPLLNRQDIMIYRLLEDYRQRYLSARFDPGSTAGKVGIAGGNDLGNFITDVNSHYEPSLLGEIEESRKNLVDSIRDKQGSESADTVFEAYKSFEKFIEQLSKNPIR